MYQVLFRITNFDNHFKVMFSMGEEVSEENAEEKIKEADLDGDGKVCAMFLFLISAFHGPLHWLSSSIFPCLSLVRRPAMVTPDQISIKEADLDGDGKVFALFVDSIVMR